MPNTRVFAGSISDLKTDMRARRRAALIANPRTRAVLGAGVTVSVSATEFDANMYQRTPNSPTEAADWAPYCVFEGGWTAYSSGVVGVYVFAATRQDPTGGTPVPSLGQTTSVARQVCPRIRFQWSGQVARFGLNASGALTARFLVNGAYVSLTGTTLSSGDNYISLDMGSVDNWEVTVELTGGEPSEGSSENHAVAFKRLYPGAQDTVRAPSRSRVLGVFGDSYVKGPVVSASNGIAATIAGDSIARIMGDWLGIDDVWCSGLAGTGYLYRTNVGTTPSLQDRIPDITSSDYDAIVLAMGINDAPRITAGDFTANEFGAAVLGILQQARVAHPQTPIIVFGPWMGSGGQGNIPAIQTQLQTQVETLISSGDRRIAFVPTYDATRQKAWQFGSGRSTAPHSGTLTLTGPVSAATSATLTAPYPGQSGSLYVLQFSDGTVKTNATLTNGSTAVSWSGAVTASSSVSYTHPTIAGNADLYLLADGTHPNAAGRSYLGRRMAQAVYDAIMAMR